MYTCGHPQELFALGRAKYINNLLNIRNKESSIELPGIEKQTDGNLEVRFRILLNNSRSKAKYLLEWIIGS